MLCCEETIGQRHWPVRRAWRGAYGIPLVVALGGLLLFCFLDFWARVREVDIVPEDKRRCFVLRSHQQRGVYMQDYAHTITVERGMTLNTERHFNLGI